MHKRLGRVCPTPTEYGPLELTVRGLERKLAKPPRRMYPITPLILRKLLTFPQPTSLEVHYTQTVISSLYIVMFFSFLRLSNLCPKSPGLFDKQFQLTWDRVGTTQKGVILKILKSKTIQDLSRVLEIPLARSQLSELCPVAALERLWNIPGYPGGAKNSVFNIPGNGGWIPLSRSHVVPVLEAQIRGMGLQPESTGLMHSEGEVFSLPLSGFRALRWS